MKYRSIKYYLLLLLVMVLMPIKVFAKEDITLKVDKTDLKAGDEVTVTAEISNDKKLYAFAATLNYDKDVFEEISENNFISSSEVVDVIYNKDNSKFGLINKSGEITNELFSIRLRVKNGANVGDTNIALTNISSSDGENKTVYDKSSIEVLITRDAVDGDIITNNTPNEFDDIKEDTIKTFSNKSIIVLLAVAIVLVLTCTIVIVKRKGKREITIFLSVLLAVLIVALMCLISGNTKRKDVNKDGETNYDDAKEIIEYIIDIKGTKEEDNNENGFNKKPGTVKPNYDVNNDGKVDINDVGSTTEKATEKTKVELKEINDDNVMYVEKGKTTLTFTANITPKDIKITKVKIDNKYYDVILNNGIYSVTVETPDVAGKHDFTITDVVLTNKKEIKTNLKFTREILKDAPSIHNFIIDEKNKTLNFELLDKEDAFISGTITVYDNDLIVTSADVEKTSTTVKVDLEEDKTYQVYITGTYDLDSNKDDDKNLYSDHIIFSHSFVVGWDYDFTLTDVSITDTVQPEEKPVISFKSTNDRRANVEMVNLTTDDEEISKDYVITKIDGNNYEVELTDADTTPGKHTVTLDSVRLNTLKTFKNVEDYKANTLTYTVLKKAPSVENIVLTDNKENRTIKVNYDFIDPENTLKNLSVVLVDSTGKIISSSKITMEQIRQKEAITLSYDNSTDGYYKIRFLADYELSDKYKYADQSIGEKDILTHDESDIYIEEIYVSDSKGQRINNVNSLYPTKGQKSYYVTFVVSVSDSINQWTKTKYGKNRTYQRVSNITINGLNYTVNNASYNGAPKYTAVVALNIPNESGILDIKVNRVQLSISEYYFKASDFYSVPLATKQIDILKDTPKIENLKIKNEDYNNKEVTFDFDVILDENAKEDDESFIDGTIELNGNEKAISRGSNSVTFSDVNQDENFDLIFKASYDLDTDLLNDITKEQNEKKNSEIHRVKYGLYDNSVYENINVENGKVISKNNNKYFEKNEKIKLNFDITNIDEELGLTPQRVIIDEKEYALTKIENGYEIILDGYTSSGKEEIKITDIILNNGKKITLKDSYKFELEVLKDVAQISDYEFEDLSDKLKITFNLKDSDKSLVGDANIKITSESGSTIYEGVYNNEISITKVKDVVRYYVKIMADYDRDTDKIYGSENYNSNAILLDEVISLDKNNIELKDITDISLYKTEKDAYEERTVLVNEIKVDELKNNLEDYFVEIKMENMPSVRARIDKIIESNNILVLALKYEYVTREYNKSQIIKVEFGSIENGIAKNESHPEDEFRALLSDLENGKNVKLTHNYDASIINTDGDTYVTSDFTGTLDGNGYTIKNLSKPLFNIINGGEVKNLTLKNVTLSIKGKAGLANITYNAKITNVIVDSITKNNTGDHQNGGLIGLAKNSTKIESCGVKNINFSVSDYQQNGGLVGCLEKSSINNSYATGKVSGSWNFNGGLVGNVQQGNISNSYAKVNATGDISCDFACSYASYGIYENNVSLGSGSKNGFISGSLKNSKNNYYLTNSENVLDGVNKITEAEVNKSLFTDRVGLDEKIWYLDNVSYDNTPTFLFEKTSSLNDTTSKDYDKSKETLYKNLLKLTPFYDSDKIIETAKKINNELLMNEEIVHIAPIESNGNLVTYLTTDNIKKISKIKIVFKNKETEEYDVTYDKTYDMVATYHIPELNIDYNYNHYVIDSDSQIINNLTNYLKDLEYTNNLDVLTTNPDSRIYRDFYNDVTSKELKEFVLKFLSNSDYTNTTNDEDINNYLEREAKEGQKIERLLYTYNYFRRFYDLEIDGMKLYDFMLFNMQGFDDSLTPIRISDLYLKDKTGASFNTNETNTKYSNILSSYTKLDTISKLLEYMVTVFGSGDLDKWTASQFKGILVELPVEGHEEVQYTLWDHFSNQDKKQGNNYGVYNHILPILTLPKDAAYIISSPVQYVIGAQRGYISDPSDPNEQKLLGYRIDSYSERIRVYFDTAYKILDDATIFNNIHTYHIDKRFTKDGNGATVYNMPYSTEEPFHKNYNEVIGMWAHSDGNAAVAWGDRIDWSAEGFMDGNIDPNHVAELGQVQEYTYHTFTHETAHNIDARLFLRDNERRFDAGGEDYADNNLMQYFGENDIVMNLSVKFNVGDRIGSNLTPERIDSPSKIHDFYNKLFETVYVMDYIEALAFLELDKDEQAKVAVQVSYPNENLQFEKDANGNYIGKTYKEDPLARFRARQTTRYTELNQLSKEELDKIELNSIDDLIDNRIMIYPGVYKISSRGSNSYGGEGINIVHWYQPNNPDGRPDSYALKWIAYEMLGLKGYEDGYIEYNSNINYVKSKIYSDLSKGASGGTSEVNYKTDTMALSKITDGEFDDFDKYKKYRFNETKNKLERLNTVVDVEEYVQKFYEALIADGEYADERLKSVLKDYNKDEQGCLKDYWCSRSISGDVKGLPNSTKVRKEIYYALKNETNDFRTDIFEKTKQQDVSNIKVNKKDN